MASETLLTPQQLLGVEGGIEFSTLKLLSDEALVEFARCYFDAKETNRRYAVQLSATEGLTEIAEHKGASDEVAMGRPRLARVQFGPTGSQRLLERLEACQLPALGSLSFAAAGDGSHSMLREYLIMLFYWFIVR